MKVKNILILASLAIMPNAFAESASTSIPAADIETIEDFEYADENGYEKCVNRKYNSETRTKPQEIGKGREQKLDHLRVETSAYDLFIVARSVGLRSTFKIGDGTGCYDRKHQRIPGAPGDTSITYKAHARSNGVGVSGAQGCELTWRECTEK